MTSLNPVQLKQIDDAWLNLEGINDEDIFNPFDFVFANDDEFHLRLTWLLISPEYLSFICKHILNIEILPSQALILWEMWHRKFPMLIATRGFGKSFLLSLYAILRALLLPRRKVVVVGAAFRQSKILFEYMETIWNNAPLLRDICDNKSGPKRDIDRCVMRINDSRITCLPLGDGQKIRGQRANDIIADEFPTIPESIFEIVVAGFGVVTSNPIANVKKAAARKLAKTMGIEIEEPDKRSPINMANQIIISGTAYYDFNHFSKYFKKWRAIIKSRGEPARLRDIFNGQDPPPDFDHREYSVIRIPYELLPEGFMDAAQVARSKATIHSGLYDMEFGAVFTRDSIGFFKRTLIESCVCNEENAIRASNGEIIQFEAKLIGDANLQYIIGIDPASEVDKFSIYVLELHPDHRRIVHGWTTTRSEHIERVRRGYVKETDFYAYCARKIRDLMSRFPTIHLSMDAQGGGIAVMEALHDKDKLREGEVAIWPVVDPEDPKPSDGEHGLHILEMCQAADFDWLSESNHGMRKDLEDKLLLFPRFDTVSLGISAIEDELQKRKYDTLEDCVMEIEALKDEMSMIQMSQSPSGRDRWDTPEVIIATGKKSKMRKDRYSAILMANAAARALFRAPKKADYVSYGGFAYIPSQEERDRDKGQEDFSGPAWFTNQMKDVYDVY